MMTIEDIKKELRTYVAEDDFEKAFDLFRKIIDDNARLENEIILQQGQYNSVMRSARGGGVAPEQTERSLNRIRAALVDMIDGIRERDLDQALLGGAEPRQSLSALSQLETQGLQRQLELSVNRLNALREAVAIQFDPNIKFALQTQIGQLEQEVAALKSKLG